MNYKPSSMRRFSSPPTHADYVLLASSRDEQSEDSPPSCPILSIPEQPTEEEANGTEESARKN